MIVRAGRRPDSLFVRRTTKSLTCAAAIAVAALVLGVSPAAAKSCAQNVIDDWYDNGRVDKVYPIRCYRAALKLLPADVRAYSNAPDEIGRALQDAIRKENQVTPPPATTGDVAGTTSNPDENPPPAETDTGEGAPIPPPSEPPTSPPSGPSSPPQNSGDENNGIVGDAIKNLGPGSADSVPVPLIIVGALAFLLLAAGSAGLIARKLQTRKVAAEELDEPGPPPRR